MAEPPDHDAEANPEETPPAVVTRELFLEWRSPRLGNANPERMNNPVWEWLIRSRLSAYLANGKLNGPDSMEAGPGWCFARFGQSATTLEDGRVVFIAGEHEDYYDPDFYIYNDVVVQHPDGRIDIFGYPRTVFPPTDFQSATLVGQRIVLIGNLGYPNDRKPESTQLLLLNLPCFEINQITASGTPPGWLHGHQAMLSEDGRSILVRGGKVDRGDKGALVENIDEWRLHLDGWRWERLTNRKWPRWEVRRADGKPNHLFEIQRAMWEKQFGDILKPDPELLRIMKEAGVPTLEEALGRKPDLETFQKLYVPSVPHESLPKVEEEYGVVRIKVGEVVVRYVEDSHSIQMTVEGDLPPEVVRRLTSDLSSKLAVLENAPCAARPL